MMTLITRKGMIAQKIWKVFVHVSCMHISCFNCVDDSHTQTYELKAHLYNTRDKLAEGKKCLFQVGYKQNKLKEPCRHE